jgi:hypothetical protein
MRCRTNYPAACASASRSPARCSAVRGCSPDEPLGLGALDEIYARSTEREELLRIWQETGIDNRVRGRTASTRSGIS